ncbi:hypothetical protein TIFTF001_046785, partial [Ficus carica]
MLVATVGAVCCHLDAVSLAKKLDMFQGITIKKVDVHDIMNRTRTPITASQPVGSSTRADPSRIECRSKLARGGPGDQMAEKIRRPKTECSCLAMHPPIAAAPVRDEEIRSRRSLVGARSDLATGWK